MKAKKPQVQTAIRLPESILKSLDKIAADLSTPSTPVTRAGVIRTATFEHVERYEASRKKR